MREIEVPTNKATEFELGEKRREERKHREGVGGTETTMGGEGESQEGGKYTLSRGGSGHKACTDRQE